MYGSEVELPTNPDTKIGYTSNDWKNSGGEEVFSPYTLTKNETLTTNWVPNTYTVIFDGNGNDGGSMDNEFIDYDEEQSLSTNEFTRTGYTFAGWSTDQDGAVKYKDGDSVNNLATEDGEAVTLYAHWTPNTYTINYNANGGSGDAMSEQSFTYDTQQDLSLNTYSLDGYTFGGWSLTEDGTVAYSDGESVLNICKNGTLNLYAVWNPRTDIPYTVINQYEQLGTTDLREETYNWKGVLGSTIEPMEVPGYVTPETQQIQITLDGKASVTYLYLLQTHTVTFYNEDETTVLEGPTSLKYGSKIEFPSPTKEGYSLYGWKVNDKTYSLREAKKLVMGEEDVVAVPIFTVHQDSSLTTTYYTVTYLDANGDVFATQSCYFGQLLAYVTGEPTKEGADGTYTFTGWNIEEGVQITGNMTLTPQFSYEENVDISDPDQTPLDPGNGNSNNGNTDNDINNNNGNTNNSNNSNNDDNANIDDNRTPTSSSPKTGDVGSFVWAALAVSSAVGLAGIGYKRRKDKDEK